MVNIDKYSFRYGYRFNCLASSVEEGRHILFLFGFKVFRSMKRERAINGSCTKMVSVSVCLGDEDIGKGIGTCVGLMRSKQRANEETGEENSLN